MYIPPFLCGIIFTIAAEVLAAVVYAACSDKNGKKKRGDDKN